MNFNNQSYDFGQASFFMLGRQVQGITGISFSSSQEAQFNYGAGNEPQTVSRGKKTLEGTISLMAFEVVALEKAIGAGKDLLDLPLFDMTITFGNDPSQISSRLIRGIKITKYDVSIDSDNVTDTVAIEFIAGSIENL